MTLRVLHLVGSPTSAFFDDLSRLYATDCLASVADPARYEMVLAHVSPDGSWRFPTSLDALADAEPLPIGAAVARLVDLDVDIALPQMFCIPGMTHVRALLDTLGITYVGNPPDLMALGAHKARARAVVAAAGVAVPAGEVLSPGEAPTLAPPVVVKPVDGDNSVGVTLVRSAGEYGAALAAAWAESGQALVEDFVPLGREVRCGIVVRDGELVALPLEEYGFAAGHEVRSAEDKIRRSDDGQLGLMAKDTPTVWIVDPADPVTTAVHQAARAAHVALGCRDYSLFDFRVDPDGVPWFLEAGLYNSFARQSVIPTMARAAGIELPELFAAAVAAALSR
ncbi:D-alanine--D-alanine ligase [Modestobacter sp. Leaf380]|uniref:D-alanine--D-alanine ligase family protein n=1 Tax=Modestobacter sp. Leaf380 TaxID=1736356 RepID=UPI0007021DFC|nr:D-alanine--D-alanine ligase [Modestobacter sp. Leaf380]KQS71168.1 D-alanine--D-alanine ligase [Modestobacter sp. Leaf380]